jgi:benzoyl-CoA reductase/2-hydroxyglutaryl-CoA dehydratase subunit BcrC/BadD/HgdB
VAMENFEECITAQPNRPASMRYFDASIVEGHEAHVKELLNKRSRGSKIIGTFCIYVPEEIVLAAGASSIALCGGTQISISHAESILPRDICPLIKSTFGLMLGNMCPYFPIVDMTVGETTCDGKKKAWEILNQYKPTYVIEVPQKKQETDKRLWLEEVRLFKEKIEELTGKKVTFENLMRSVKIMNRKRQSLSEMHSFRKDFEIPISGTDALLVTQVSLFDEPERFTQQVEVLNKELKNRVHKKIKVFPDSAKRVMIAGCPSVAPNWKIHHLVETLRAAVVCDETCTGYRYYANPVDENASGLEGLLQKIAERYMQINCSCFTPNEERIEQVVKLVKEYNVDGVIQYVLQYCHGYNMEAVKLQQELRKRRIPVLKLETDYSDEDIQPLKIRVEAFLEMLEAGDQD